MRRFATYGPSLLVLVTAASVLLIGPKAIRSMQAAFPRIAIDSTIGGETFLK